MTQSEQILTHLRSRSISAIEALGEYGCFRLAARIDELRKAGHRIESRTVKANGKRYARYQLSR